MLMVVIGKSLWIFSDTTFKMAAWWPYWMFWFLDSNFSLAVNINSKFSGTMLMYMGRSLLIFSNINFKMAFYGFLTLTLGWLWIWTINFSGTVLMYMCKSLLIFSDVNFKMAAWQPYWIFWFPDCNFSLALNMNSKLQWPNTCVYE